MALDEVLSAGAVHGLPVFAAYESYLEHREGTCPSMEDPESEGPYGVWQTDHCETGAGYVFEGFGLYLVDCTDPADNDMEPGVGVDSRGLVSQYRLKAPDGAEMEAGGDCSHECRFDVDGGVSCFDQVGGSYRADGREPWLDVGVEASLFVTHEVGADGRRTTIDGGIGLPAADISFREVEVDWEECDGLATGTVAIRDPSGWWFSLVLSGDCSGYGELWLGDQDLGQICIDLAGTLRDAVAGWEQPCWL
ncbi:MAG: hypothetical protein D6798_07355 [Deltaproteobacteria bacterium]|nr:MAG: hypothetical protein D6798_07355 [Deltaproteobacteria bacterium]